MRKERGVRNVKEVGGSHKEDRGSDSRLAGIIVCISASNNEEKECLLEAKGL